MRTTLISLCAAGLLCAADGSLTGPVAGFVFDANTRAMQTVVGVPGAAYVASAVIADVDAGRMSPDGKAVAVVRGGSLLVQRPGSEAWTSAVLATDLNADARLAWSADSQFIAAAEGDAIRLWKADGTLVTRGSLSAPALALAAADSRVAAATEVGVFLLEDGKVRSLSINPATSVAIAGADLFFADRTRGEVWTLRGYTGSGELALVAKIDAPAGVASDGRNLLVASAAAKKVVAVALPSLELAYEIPLDFEPSSFDSFGPAAWLLNSGGAGALQLFTAGQEPAVYFVPRQEGN